jgi:hypothetical protein
MGIKKGSKSIVDIMDELTEAPAPTPPAAPPADPVYQLSTKEDVEALWAELGRDAVKAIPGFRAMKFSAIRKALGK